MTANGIGWERSEGGWKFSEIKYKEDSFGKWFGVGKKCWRVVVMAINVGNRSISVFYFFFLFSSFFFLF